MGLLSIDRATQQALRASKLRGVWPAIVADNKDGPDNPGYRVRLKFPWLTDQETTFWARIAIPMAGPDRGTYVLPEIEDQVLVVFEHGDINRPIVVGALWSKPQEPVEVNQSGHNNTKLLKSRCGHRIIFDDQQGGETITIAPASPASNPPRPKDDHVYVIHARLSAPGGNALGGEQVVLLKAGTTEPIAGPFTTDADGSFAAIVPENTPYDVQILDTEHAPPARSSSDDAVQNHLHVGLFDSGMPLANERVTVVGPDGSSRELTLSAGGMLDLVAEPGEHQITVRGETFHAHTLTAADLADGGSHYEFAVRPAPPDLETARASRYSPGPDHDQDRDDDGVA